MCRTVLRSNTCRLIQINMLKLSRITNRKSHTWSNQPKKKKYVCMFLIRFCRFGSVGFFPIGVWIDWASLGFCEKREGRKNTSWSCDEGEIGLFEVGHETGIIFVDAVTDYLVELVHFSDLFAVSALSEDLFLGRRRGNGRFRYDRFVELPLLKRLLCRSHGKRHIASLSPSLGRKLWIPLPLGFLAAYALERKLQIDTWLLV